MTEGASPSLVVAAFLHDVGHLLDHPMSRFGVYGARTHAEIGATFLVELGFPLSVTEPVRLHVEAKRYLFTTEANYLSGKPPETAETLAHQGGRMGLHECRLFEMQPFFDEAVALRRWDDGAKDPDAVVPDDEPVWAAVEQVLAANGQP